MPRIQTRRKGNPGKSFKNAMTSPFGLIKINPKVSGGLLEDSDVLNPLAMTYKQRNGLSNTLNSYSYIGNGSYGTIYQVHNSNVVFKLHQNHFNCDNWQHEFLMHKQIYNSCNSLLQNYDVCIVKPYSFKYVKKTQNGLVCTQKNSVADACIYSMDKIVAGPKWDKFLSIPLPIKHIPPYVFLGTIGDKKYAITLDKLKENIIVSMPNEGHSFCSHVGPFTMERIQSMTKAFFTMLEAGFMPRDIEYVLDGRKHTQSYIAILDFNEVMTIKDREIAYGSGYCWKTDAAHTYIDLCGIRSSQTRNPMAPYNEPTPQWQFLCNPLTAPGAFLESMKLHKDVANIILRYAETQMLPIIQKKSQCNQIVYPFVYVVNNIHEIPDKDMFLGSMTEKELYELRANQCVFHRLESFVGNQQDVQIFVGTNNIPPQRIVLDPFVEFDLLFQAYVLSSLCETMRLRGHVLHMNGTFWDILQRVQAIPTTIPVEESWEGLGLF